MKLVYLSEPSAGVALSLCPWIGDRPPTLGHQPAQVPTVDDRRGVAYPPGLLTNPTADQGCLLGGAVGDALGAPVEFLAREEIQRAEPNCPIRSSRQVESVLTADAWHQSPAYGLFGSC